jgi:hypothetical protein
MSKSSTTETRSWFTTITSSLIGLIITVFTIMLLPINSVPKVFFLIGAAVAVFLCILFALEGKKGTVKELIDSILNF